MKQIAKREREREREVVGLVNISPITGEFENSTSSVFFHQPCGKKGKNKKRDENPKHRTIRLDGILLKKCPKSCANKIKYFRTHQHESSLVTTNKNKKKNNNNRKREREKERKREKRERVENRSTVVVVVKIFSSLDLRVFIFYARWGEILRFRERVYNSDVEFYTLIIKQLSSFPSSSSSSSSSSEYKPSNNAVANARTKRREKKKSFCVYIRTHTEGDRKRKNKKG